MERQPQSQETIKNNSEELEQLANQPERHEQLVESAEKQHEQVEQARETIEKQAETAAKVTEVTKEPAHHPTRLDKLASYKETMASLQRHMSPASRRFSKFIHNPVVDKTSEALGNTVLRPSFSLGATTGMLLVGGAFYFVARQQGFMLAGSEFWIALLAGGLIGLLLEFIYKVIIKLFKR